MKTSALALFGCLLVSGVAFSAYRLQKTSAPGYDPSTRTYTLYNGWKVTPVGTLVDLPGDMPGSLVFMPDGKHALVNTCGFHDHSVNLVNLETGKIVSSLPLSRNWMGLTSAGQNEFWLSGGEPDLSRGATGLMRFSVEGDRIKPLPGLNLPGVEPSKQFVSGMISLPNGKLVLNIQTDEAILLSPEGKEISRTRTAYRPYAAALSPDRSTVAISNWGDSSVSLFDAESLKEKTRIKVGVHPTALLYHPDGRLFVTQSGTKSVAVITGARVTESIDVGDNFEQEIGTVPVSLALTPDGKTLFVANAGNNCVAQVSVANPAKSVVEGFIPTDRYPGLVAVSPDGKRLIIGTAKGHHGPNAGKAVKLDGAQIRGKDYGTPYRYMGQQLAGQLSILNIPDSTELAALTKIVRGNRRDILAESPTLAERKRIEREAFSKIKHVIFVIRENRTYDQVLGDIKKGNGDPSLTIFGEKITPNGHKIANEFVLFDNLYASGEVSQSGHQWTDAAYATDYCEKMWMLNYSGKGEVDSDTRLTSSPGEYIWSLARKHGKWARVYGEYVDVQEDHGSLDDPQMKANPERYGYSKSFEEIFARNGRDTEKVDDFLKEMRAAEKTGKWPDLMVMALPEDHTDGFRPGRFTPAAMIGSNDLAIGKLAHEVGRSKFWKETAIFIIQDDAQDGPDHVDSHRTVGYVISPYTRRGILDSTHYTSVSMLRTMEMMLGLPPMSQYDGTAMPMYNAFTVKPDFKPFAMVQPTLDINEKNKPSGELARRSMELDFSEVDKADFDKLNRLLWDGYRPGVPYPGIRNGAIRHSTSVK